MLAISVGGAVLGGLLGTGCWVVANRLLARGRPSLEARVQPYLRDLPGTPVALLSGQPSFSARVLTWVAGQVERVLGGAASIRSRLDRADLSLSVHEFRIEQAVWGVVGFLVCAVPAGLVAAQHPDRGPALFVCCVAALCLGVILRENRLTAQVRLRERRILEELPIIAEYLSLAVAAGEGPLAALDRVVARSNGKFAADLRRLIGQTRTGMPLTEALDQLAVRSGLAPVARFAHGLAIAIERGTPLADLLNAQAADVREAGRRALIESGARREVLMMVPVVFLILPTVVVFAFWPGLVGLRLVVP